MTACYSPAPEVTAPYHAHRYQQMKEIAHRLPFWRYWHSLACEVPDCDHLAWDKLVLRHDDPWWDGHYPSVCGCYVEALGPLDMAQLGKSGPDVAPN